MNLKQDIGVEKSLYIEDGMEETTKIWAEFERARKEIIERKGGGVFHESFS